MLVLARRKGQVINIGDDITVTVVSAENGHVRIGIEAPHDIPVHRHEVYKRILAERVEEAMEAERRAS